MLAMRNPMFAPPGGKWFYLVPETGYYVESPQGKQTVFDRVVRHYVANGIPVPENLDALIEDYVCRNVVYGACIGEDPRAPGDRPLTYFEVVEALEKFFRGRDRQLVEPREAEQRGLVCIKCPMHSLGMCTSCNELRQQTRRFVKNRALLLDNQLGICRVMRIPTNGLIHVAEFDSKLTFPENCWVTPKGKTA